MYFIPPPARGRQAGVGHHNTAHAEMESKARNPGPGATTLPTTHAGTESGQAMRPNKGRAPI